MLRCGRPSSLTGVVFSVREVVLCELDMDGRHLWGKVQRLLIAGDHGLGAGAALVRCGHLQHTNTKTSTLGVQNCEVCFFPYIEV